MSDMNYRDEVTARHVRMALDCQHAAFGSEVSDAILVLALEEALYLALFVCGV